MTVPEDRPREQRPARAPLEYAALSVSAGVVLLPLLIGNIAAYLFKLVNPENVDITHGLAYLGQILIIGWGSVGLVLVVAVVLNMMAQQRYGRAPGWIVLGVQVTLGILLLGSQFAIDSLT